MERPAPGAAGLPERAIRYSGGLEIHAMLTSIPARPDPAAQPTPLSREDLLRGNERDLLGPS